MSYVIQVSEGLSCHLAPFRSFPLKFPLIFTLQELPPLQARTELVAMVDVDLVLNKGFVQHLANNPGRSANQGD